MEIFVENLQKKITLNPSQILKITRTILRHEDVQAASLSIVFVTRQRIKALNKKFLHRDYCTDVLAFETADEGCCDGKRRASKSGKSKEIAGDIIISTDAALKNSRVYATDLSRELSLYIIHGILHLLGFDDHTIKDAAKMRKKEKKLLAHLGSAINGILK